MTPDTLAVQLDALGVRLSVQGERLRVEAPAGVLTSELRQAIARHKVDLMALLSGPNEIDEFNEVGDRGELLTSLNSSISSLVDDSLLLDDVTAAVARWRSGLKRSLQQWDDDHLVALAGWHLVVGFGRGGPKDFRRYLPRSLANLTDTELAAIVDWSSMATLEQTMWRSDPTLAARISRGAQKLATWWHARRAEPRVLH
jgi:hypothetical protein